MLDRALEYQKMAESEQILWWYQALHDLTLNTLEKQYSQNRDIAIVDAGCGTGGMLMHLKQKGYTNISGFDLSEDAVQWCQNRGLSVHKNDLLAISTKYAPNSVDVIISNDTLCYLDTNQREEFIRNCHLILRPGGLLVLNLPALNAFGGIHDVAVGIKKRFSRKSIADTVNLNDFQFINQLYWPFLLSPIIFLARSIQRLQMRVNTDFEVKSDVNLPNRWLNAILLFITRIENHFIPIKPFGSSLFVVLNKR